MIQSPLQTLNFFSKLGHFNCSVNKNYNLKTLDAMNLFYNLFWPGIKLAKI